MRRYFPEPPSATYERVLRSLRHSQARISSVERRQTREMTGEATNRLRTLNRTESLDAE